jgi:RES domain-containing protein
MILWRISNYASLDGQGGTLSSARWHTAGQPIVYLAESPSGALTEIIVHLELRFSQFPQTYKLPKIETASDLAINTIDEKELPANWKFDPIFTRGIGDEWLASRPTALLRVPSAIAPETWNVLLNPKHADAARMTVLWHREYLWDPRLFKPTQT